MQPSRRREALELVKSPSSSSSLSFAATPRIDASTMIIKPCSPLPTEPYAHPQLRRPTAATSRGTLAFLELASPLLRNASESERSVPLHTRRLCISTPDLSARNLCQQMKSWVALVSSRISTPSLFLSPISSQALLRIALFDTHIFFPSPSFMRGLAIDGPR